jgi:hypothetical protein
MKTITLTFAVPVNLDTPSETLARMKQLLIDALAAQEDLAPLHGTGAVSEADQHLINALLTES